MQCPPSRTVQQIQEWSDVQNFQRGREEDLVLRSYYSPESLLQQIQSMEAHKIKRIHSQSLGGRNHRTPSEAMYPSLMARTNFTAT